MIRVCSGNSAATAGANYRLRVAIELAEQGISVLLCPFGELLGEVLNLFPAGISESFRAAEVDGVGLYEFGIELVLADDLAETLADLRASAFPVPIRFLWGKLFNRVGFVPIFSTEQMPIP
jgi:hypothetical protein